AGQGRRVERPPRDPTVSHERPPPAPARATAGSTAPPPQTYSKSRASATGPAQPASAAFTRVYISRAATQWAKNRGPSAARRASASWNSTIAGPSRASRWVLVAPWAWSLTKNQSGRAGTRIAARSQRPTRAAVAGWLAWIQAFSSRGSTLVVQVDLDLAETPAARARPGRGVP